MIELRRTPEQRDIRAVTPTYAPAADWRYAGIQLLFNTAKPERLIHPDRILLQDLSVSTPHQDARS